MTDQTPFSNGTEASWWQHAWCDHCDRDHGMHNGQMDGGCDIFGGVLATVALHDFRLPECWIENRAQPVNAVPPERLVCLAFTPCGACGGDPAPDRRAELVDEALHALNGGDRG